MIAVLRFVSALGNMLAVVLVYVYVCGKKRMADTMRKWYREVSQSRTWARLCLSETLAQ